MVHSLLGYVLYASMWFNTKFVRVLYVSVWFNTKFVRVPRFLEKALEEYSHDTEQRDDILFIGFSLI